MTEGEQGVREPGDEYALDELLCCGWCGRMNDFTGGGLYCEFCGNMRRNEAEQQAGSKMRAQAANGDEW